MLYISYKIFFHIKIFQKIYTKRRVKKNDTEEHFKIKNDTSGKDTIRNGESFRSVLSISKQKDKRSNQV